MKSWVRLFAILMVICLLSSALVIPASAATPYTLKVGESKILTASFGGKAVTGATWTTSDYQSVEIVSQSTSSCEIRVVGPSLASHVIVQCRYSYVTTNGGIGGFGGQGTVDFDITVEPAYVTVTFQPKGGTTPVNQKTVSVGETYGALPEPSREGYTFDGWYTSSSGGTLVASYKKVTNNKDHSLYARWSKIPVYCTVTFDANGGTVDPATQKLECDSSYGPLPEPVREGYTFIGWFTTAQGGSRVKGSSTVPGGDHTLYAQWCGQHVPESDAAVDATCTKTGLSEGSHCAICGEVLQKQEVVAALGHLEEPCPGKMATCTETGLAEGTQCARCGILISQEKTPALGHSYADGYCVRCGAMDFSVFKAHGTCGEKLIWTLDDVGTLHIFGSGQMINYTQYTGVPWNKYAGQVKKVIIDAGATNVGNYAFYGCSKLTEVSLPEGITKLGTRAFAGCTTLTEIRLPKSFARFDAGVFYNCTKLVSVEIPEGVTFIPTLTFFGCAGLKEIAIPDGVTLIGNNAFKGCSALAEIMLPASLATVESYGFQNCTKLKNVYYGGTEETWSAVKIASDNEPLTKATMHYQQSGTCGEKLNWVLDRGTLTISGTGDMSSYTKASQLPWYTHRKDIRKVVVESGVTGIGSYAFYQYSSLKEIYFEGDAPTFMDPSGKTLSKVKATAYYPEDNPTWTDAVMKKYGGTITWKSWHMTHHWGEWQESVSASCTGEGELRRACTGCEVYETQSVAALGHTPEAIPGKAATCTETGLTEGSKCSVCQTELVPQKKTSLAAHTPQVIPGKAATCQEEGITEGSRCTVCQKVLKEQKVVPVGDHTPEAVPGKAATCLETGLSDGSRCSVCQTELRKQEVLPLGDHTPETVPGKTATCLETGWSDGSVCAICKTELKAQEELPLTDHTPEQIPGKAPTCTQTGQRGGKRCSICQIILEQPTEIGMISHGNAEIPGKIATCTENGLTDGMECPMCGLIRREQKVIPALGHNYIDDICVRCKQSRTRGCGRLSGDDRYATSFAIADQLKQVLGVDKFRNVVLASSENFADALAGSYLAAMKEAPILIAKQKYADRVCDYLNGNLVPGGMIYILGGEQAMPASILDGIEIDYQIRRLEGEDRYGTNLAILNELPVGSQDLLVATGRDFADSLSASATGLPILLVNSKTGKHLSQEQKVFLGTVEGAVYIIGGESAVNGALQQEIELAIGRSAARISGGSRYETSVEIAKKFLPDAATAVAAYASTFPDGLCGGPLAYAEGAPLILTKDGKSEAPAYTKTKDIASGFVLGGTGLISDQTADQIFGAGSASEEGKTGRVKIVCKECDGSGYESIPLREECGECDGTGVGYKYICPGCGKNITCNICKANGGACSQCDSTGGMFCTNCDKHLCESCGKVINCGICGGDGYRLTDTKCESCSGTGIGNCSVCNPVEEDNSGSTGGSGNSGGSGGSGSSSSGGSNWKDDDDNKKQKCVKCRGDGEITCSRCGGQGGKWVKDYSTPNYSGNLGGSKPSKTWEKCSKCRGSGKMNCTSCGGSGTR